MQHPVRTNERYYLAASIIQIMFLLVTRYVCDTDAVEKLTAQINATAEQGVGQGTRRTRLCHRNLPTRLISNRNRYADHNLYEVNQLMLLL